LVLVALAASSIQTVLQITRGTAILSPEMNGHWTFFPAASKSLWALRTLGMASFLSAGFLACLQGGIRSLDVPTLVAMAPYGLAACCWTFVGLASMPIRDFIVGPQSPLIWLLCLGVFAGTQREVWKHLDRIAGVAAWLLLPLMLYSVMKIKYYGRFDGVSPNDTYLSLVTWLSAYHLLSSPGTSVFRSAIRAIPLLGCCLVAVLSQGRGWVLQCLLALALLTARPLFLRAPRALSKLLKNGALALAAVIATVFFLLHFYPLAVEGLLGRLGQDSRTEQYSLFFAQVPWTTLINGAGPMATYRFGRDLSYEFFDNQFIWMIFRGGIFIFVGYAVLVLLPGLRLIRRAQCEADFAAGATLLLWTLGLAGLSTYLNVNFNAQNYFIVTLAGYCHLRLRALACSRKAAACSFGANPASPVGEVRRYR
jgi:hypothetical protein